MIRVGELELHLLLESRTLADGGGAFGLVPKAMWSRDMPPDDDNLVPMNQHLLLLRAGGRTILIDVGIGSKMPAKWQEIWHLSHPKGTVDEALARLGLTRANIDLVVDTHLHNDHCGGNTVLAEDGSLQPAFPNAEYVTQRREYEDAMQPNERTRATYIPANYAPLVERGQMRLLDGDTELAPGVYGVVTPGHTPAHMSIRFESRGEHALFTCDMATYSVLFERLGWMTAYDVEPLITLETKRKWQQWAMQTNALLIFPHDPLRPAARLAPVEGGRPRLKAVPVEFA
ncbi:MAG TPA: MBL fold metallo-hydrolase [Candidatus Limnocylindrales bacterium]|nr:MBL fold metallo-hydrolase [Candidatus Limnocylindrales bacterium]